MGGQAGLRSRLFRKSKVQARDCGHSKCSWPRFRDHELVVGGKTEVREVLERLHAISVDVSEELDAYQQRYARWVR